MKTSSLDVLNDEADVLADEKVVMRCLVERRPVPDDVVRRVRERGRLLTQEIYETQGDIDVARLLRDDDA